MRPAVPGAVPPGARVALVAPAGPPPPELVERAVERVRAWGYEPALLPSVGARHGSARYLSGSDAQRAADVQAAWCDPAYAAVFCVRGGYGTARILDLLDADAMRRASITHGPKPLFGSSDITALHEWIREHLGVATWFAPMLATTALLDDPVAEAGVRDVLRGTPPEPLSGAASIVAGEATGRLVGGNLSLLAMTLAARGRPSLDHSGTIVVLEDVGEETYRLDGYLTALLRAGWFDGVAGIACGTWLACDPEPDIRALVTERLGGLGVPLGWGFDIGHAPGARTVALGVLSRLWCPSEGPPRLQQPPESQQATEMR